MANFQIFSNKWEKMDNMGFSRMGNNQFAIKLKAFVNYFQNLGTKIWYIIDARCESFPVSPRLKFLTPSLSEI